jgi:hypothetical protein
MRGVPGVSRSLIGEVRRKGQKATPNSPYFANKNAPGRDSNPHFRPRHFMSDAST